MPVTMLVERIAEHPAAATALLSAAETVSYGELRAGMDAFARRLLDGRADLAEARVALLLPPGRDYVTALLGIWRAGGVAVPLSTGAADRELQNALQGARAGLLVSGGHSAARIGATCRELGIARVAVAEDALEEASAPLPRVVPARRAMMLFTSGTTSRPKGVVSSHCNLSAQIGALIAAWRWSGDDRIALFLPLHHVHGIVNVLCCALWAGASVDLLGGFDAEAVLGRVAEGRYTLFMAVPTIYLKLIAALEQMPARGRQLACAGFGAMRLAVSGSAACPLGVHQKWRELTGQPLLERYGMTEIGMALSNPYQGERRPGTVGQPLPGVEVMLADENGVRVDGDHRPGEIWVRGDNVFVEYWDDPQATRQAFAEGWFRSGDIGERIDGYYRILGRSSVDIIKSGGYKLSALEIESALLDHPAIAECAVVGLADDTWGEAVHAAVVLKGDAQVSAGKLRAWCKQRMSSYKVPKSIHFLEELPRNALGKVTKPALRSLLKKVSGAAEKGP